MDCSKSKFIIMEPNRKATLQVVFEKITVALKEGFEAEASRLYDIKMKEFNDELAKSKASILLKVVTDIQKVYDISNMNDILTITIKHENIHNKPTT